MTEEINIQFIESWLSKLHANWAEGATLREIALVFSMLRVGISVPRLVEFTGYEAKFVHDVVQELTRNRILLTGLPSRTFCLWQCRGAEDLIEAITGQPLPTNTTNNHSTQAKEKPMSKQIAKCQRDAACVKPPMHKGRCRTIEREDLPEQEPLENAKAKSAPTSEVLTEVITKNAKAVNGNGISAPVAKFSIHFEEGENKISLHGVGRDRFLTSFNSLAQLLEEVKA